MTKESDDGLFSFHNVKYEGADPESTRLSLEKALGKSVAQHDLVIVGQSALSPEH